MTQTKGTSGFEGGLKVIDPGDWTLGMQEVAIFVNALTMRLWDRMVTVHITNDPGLKFSATYGPGGDLVLSKRHLGINFFNTFPHNMDKVLSLLIHEFGHEYSCDHLSSAYHRALCDLGAKITLIAVKEPGLFR